MNNDIYTIIVFIYQTVRFFGYRFLYGLNIIHNLPEGTYDTMAQTMDTVKTFLYVIPFSPFGKPTMPTIIYEYMNNTK